MRTAVVTGSARGIGAAVAERLAQSGYQVVGVDRSPHEAGYLARTVVADLGSAAQCAEVFEQVGHVDALVNNAALLVDRPLEETTVDDMDSLLSVNLRAAMIMTKLALPGMVERGWGRVVNMSSVGARTGGYASSGVYNTTKAGLISFTKYVARHYGPHGVTANAVAPGGIRTEMMAHLDDDQLDEYRSLIPVGRLGTPLDVARAVDFLMAADSDYINGVTLDVNGGWFMA